MLSLANPLENLPSPLHILNLTIPYLLLSTHVPSTNAKNLIIDTDIFSDVDDTAALLLANTLPTTNLLGININYPSSYSAIAASSIAAHYGHPNVPIGLRRPVSNDTFFDDWSFEFGEYASKVAYHWSNGSVGWGEAPRAWEPVELYRMVLSGQEDGSVTIASIGFLENLSNLLNSTADEYSPLAGPELVAAKVKELVVMGGQYPSGREFNFYGDEPESTAHVVSNYKGKMTFLGNELGSNVSAGARFTVEAPKDDPVKAAYQWYVGYNTTRYSWDPLTVLYACQGLGELFEYAGEGGYNHVYPNGSNVWIEDEEVTNQHYLRLKTDNITAANTLDDSWLKGAKEHGS